MKRLFMDPYVVLLLAATAAFVSLLLGGLISGSSPQAPAPDPLAALQSATLCPSYDVAFWSRLASEDPQKVEQGRAYCATHHDRPNCQALATASFLSSPAAGIGLLPRPRARRLSRSLEWT